MLLWLDCKDDVGRWLSQGFRQLRGNLPERQWTSGLRKLQVTHLLDSLTQVNSMHPPCQSHPLQISGVWRKHHIAAGMSQCVASPGGWEVVGHRRKDMKEILVSPNSTDRAGDEPPSLGIRQVMIMPCEDGDPIQ
jgi:hypothetical protein